MVKTLEPKKIVTTIHLNKYNHGNRLHERAERSIKQIIKTGQKLMGTEKVKVDQELNSRIWYRGRSSPPIRVRVVYERKADSEETGKMFTVATYKNVASFEGLQTEKVVDQ